MMTGIALFLVGVAVGICVLGFILMAIQQRGDADKINQPFEASNYPQWRKK